MKMKVNMIKTTLLATLLAIPAVSQVGAKWRMGKNTLGFKALQLDQAKGHFHDAIPYGITMMNKFALDSGFTITHVTDGTPFTQANLAKYDMIILNNCTQLPLILNAAQQAAFQWYVEQFTGTDGISQGGVFGWHGSTDVSTSTWKWYTNWIVGEFGGHSDHSGMAVYLPGSMLPAGKGVAANDVTLEGVNLATWKFSDENYDWVINPYSSTSVTTIAYLNYGGTTPVNSFTWKSTAKKARMVMTGIGHSIEILQDPNMVHHFAGVLKWVAGPAQAAVFSLANDIEFSAPSINKTRGGFTVNFTKNTPHSITVTSLTGKILARESGSQLRSYDFSNRFQAGMYWVKIHTSAGDRVQKVSVL